MLIPANEPPCEARRAENRGSPLPGGQCLYNLRCSVLAGGALPSEESVPANFLADDDNDISKLRQRELGDDI